MDLESYFEETFLSFKMGIVKPDLAAYRVAIDRFNVKPERIFFVDDNLINVEAAWKLGLKADCVKGFEELEACLMQNNLL